MKRKKYSRNKVYIVGAGPGDSELITLKGFKIMKKADCVIYDYLVNKKLLRYAPKTAELINADDIRNEFAKHPRFIGDVSVANSHHNVADTSVSVSEAKNSFSDGFTKEQDKLNNLIVEKSKKYKTVVRLKNGDTVIFGRLNEEIFSLVKNKIDFEIIPGITAASSASASLNIGLTKTKLAPVVSFITGHENPSGKKSSVNYALLPKQGTLVFYMAVEQIGKLAGNLIDIGWNKNTFCGIVERASFSDEKSYIGKLKDIKKLVLKINSPSVFIVGNVLKYAFKKK
ncbi:MAG: uroporphyrinogen-III C-methyltransferase [Elusimicrobiota bacterium]|nr:uroporphyrinogen-III C-methyltransferase [Elusimicrobiota bacterium]